jgi:hypothetical protein
LPAASVALARKVCLPTSVAFQSNDHTTTCFRYRELR